MLDTANLVAGGCAVEFPPIPRCGGWECRNPNHLTSQSHWHIFKCKRGGRVWHVNGPARSWDGTVIPMNVDYDCGTEALEAFNKGWGDVERYAQRLVMPRD